MECLIYLPSVNRGGVHRVVEILLAEFALQSKKRAINFTILGQKYDENGVEVQYPAKMRFIQIDPVEKLPAHPNQFPFLAQNAPIFYQHLRRIADNYDLIFNIYPFWAMDRMWDIKVPFVTMIPDLAFDFIDMGSYLSGYFRDATALIKAFTHTAVFPSNFHRLHAEKRYKFKRTTTIYHSADFVSPESDKPAISVADVRLKYALPERYVLAFHPMGHKGVDIIMQAQHLARSKSPYIPPIVLSGIDTQHLIHPVYSDLLLEKTRKLIFNQLGAGLGRDIFVTGVVDEEDILPLHQGATVAITASSMDGDISGPMFDAIRSKTPLIAPNLPVYQERLTQNEVLFFPSGDVDALADAIIDVSENPNSAALRAENAYEWRKSRTVKDVANEYLRLFSEIADPS